MRMVEEAGGRPGASGLGLPRVLTRGAVLRLASALRRAQSAVTWWYVDLCAAARGAVADAELAEVLDISPRALGDLRTLAGLYPPERRVEGVTAADHGRLVFVPDARDRQRLLNDLLVEDRKERDRVFLAARQCDLGESSLPPRLAARVDELMPKTVPTPLSARRHVAHWLTSGMFGNRYTLSSMRSHARSLLMAEAHDLLLGRGRSLPPITADLPPEETQETEETQDAQRSQLPATVCSAPGPELAASGSADAGV